MRIGEMTLWLIGQRHMTQKEFSSLTGIRTGTISAWKENNRNPSSDKILDICRVLEVTPEYLLNGDPDAEQDPGMSASDQAWLDIIHSIPEEKQSMCRDFLKSHGVENNSLRGKRNA